MMKRCASLLIHRKHCILATARTCHLKHGRMKMKSVGSDMQRKPTAIMMASIFYVGVGQRMKPTQQKLNAFPNLLDRVPTSLYYTLESREIFKVSGVVDKLMDGGVPLLVSVFQTRRPIGEEQLRIFGERV